MPAIMIPGKNQKEADRFAKEEEARILAKQYSDPDFILCRHGEKDWSGADPCCAFNENGTFREHNWNCFLMNKIRVLMGQQDESAPGQCWWDDDQNYGVLYVSTWADGIWGESYLKGCFILMDWYKSRGATDSFRILEGDTIRLGTEKDAEELIRLYTSYFTTNSEES